MSKFATSTPKVSAIEPHTSNNFHIRHSHLRYTLLASLCLAYPCLSTSALAQTQDSHATPISYFNPIVVTATRSNKALNDAPVPVQVISRQQLENNHAHTLKEAIDLLPNVFLRPIHGKSGSQVVMQGFSGDRVLVLIDGLPITASTSSVVDLSQYLNMDIEQIEVIQGAASAQYGSSAMGGVINVITKPIARSKGHVTAELASNGEQNASRKNFDANKRFVEASIEGALDKQQRIHARLSGSYLDDKGLRLANNDDEWEVALPPTTRKQVNAKLVYTSPNSLYSTSAQNTPASSKYWLEVGHYQQNDFKPYLDKKDSTWQQREREDAKKTRISVGGQTDIINGNNKKFHVSATGFHEGYQSITHDRGSLRDTQIDTNLAQMQVDLPAWQLSEHQSHLVQVGGQWQQNKLKQTKDNVTQLAKDKVQHDVKEVYLQDDWFIGDNWEVLTGIRYQNDSDFGSHTAPKISLKYRTTDQNLRDHIFRASVGKGYRVPTLKDRYFIYDHSNNPGFPYKVLGNPQLTPETSNSYQLGYQVQINDELNVSTNAFYNTFDNLIITEGAGLENGVNVFRYVNSKSGKTYGGDIGVTWQNETGAAVNLNYAYTKTKDDETGKAQPFIPEHKLTASATTPVNDKIQFVQRATLEGKQLVRSDRTSGEDIYSKGWWTYDSKVNFQANKNLDLYLGINNLFNKQRNFNDPDDYRPINNRELFVGANYHW